MNMISALTYECIRFAITREAVRASIRVAGSERSNEDGFRVQMMGHGGEFDKVSASEEITKGSRLCVLGSEVQGDAHIWRPSISIVPRATTVLVRMHDARPSVSIQHRFYSYECIHGS